MPLWGTPKAGANPISSLNFTSISPGDDIALLDGTETVATGSKSIAFARGMTGSTDAGTTFQVTGCAGGSVIDIQASNGVSQSTTGTPTVIPTLANMDASFGNVSLSGGGGTVTGNGFYTDIGRSAFYRVIVTLLVDGDVPVVIVKR